MMTNKKLSDIPFPKDVIDEKNQSYLQKRLDRIKELVFGEKRTKQISDRYIISIKKEWASELNISYTQEEGKEYLSVFIFPGDTKEQGKSYFKRGKCYHWEEGKICGYKVEAREYLKFSHFGKGILWLILDKEESKKTHNYEFFSNWSGRYDEKWSKNWKDDFVKELNKIIPNWIKRTTMNYEEPANWNDIIVKSNRSYFNLSMGTFISILIPYSDAQTLDDTDDKQNKLAEKVRDILAEITKIVEA